jgi:hypothetical protein
LFGSVQPDGIAFENANHMSGQMKYRGTTKALKNAAIVFASESE